MWRKEIKGKILAEHLVSGWVRVWDRGRTQQ